MIDEPFAHQATWVHALDPRLRVGTAFVLSCLFAITQQPVQAVLALAGSALLLGCSRPRLRPLLHRLGAMNLFVLVLWLTVPLLTPGKPLLTWKWFTWTQEGLDLVWLITCKANAITMLIIACVGTMPASLFGHALQALHLPRTFVYLLLFTYRSLFLLTDEWQRLQTSLKLRNFVPGTNLHTYRTLGYLLGLTLVRSLDRAQRMQQAMLLRGFNGTLTSLTLLRFRRIDCLFIGLLVLFLVLFVGGTMLLSPA